MPGEEISFGTIFLEKILPCLNAATHSLIARLADDKYRCIEQEMFHIRELISIILRNQKLASGIAIAPHLDELCARRQATGDMP
jgi:hypothetical protein